MTKAQKLQKIAADIEKCAICKAKKHGKAVPGEGNPDADILFLGEAPGKQEAANGRPFIGRSGKLLRSLIKEVGLDENDVYITSPVKYLPDYITPTPKDIAHGKLHLDEQLAVIDPKVIVLLGATAAKAVLSHPVSILKDHGKVFTKDNSPRGEAGRKYFLTLHPAAALRFKKNKPLLVEDFRKLKKILGK